MDYDWYKIANLDEFDEADLPSRTIIAELEDLGTKEILLTRGELYSVVFDEQFMPIGLSDKNPFIQGEWAVYQDQGRNVWIGKMVSDEN